MTKTTRLPVLFFDSPTDFQFLKSQFFGTFPRAPITICITLTSMFHCFFRFLERFKYLLIFLLSFSDPQKRQNPVDGSFFFIIIINTWSGLLAGICISKFQGIFMGFILWNKFLFMRIPFGRMVNFQFLAQFPVNYLSYQVMATIALLSDLLYD